MERRFRIALWVLLGVVALTLLVRAGSIPLIDTDESRFARTSLEMMRSHDPVVPRFEGEPRLVKPPLLNWIQAFLFATFGFSSLTARLPAALATLASIFILGVTVRRRFGSEGAFWAAAVLATTPLVVILGRVGTLDALLAVHVFAVVALDLGAGRKTLDGPAHPARAGAIGALLGLAFLAKGPVGVLLPLLLMLAGRTATRRELLPARRSALVALAGWCVVVLPWGLALLRQVGSDAVLAVLRGEVMDRYLAGTTHVQPPWYYLVVLGAAFFPWQVPFFIGAIRLVRRYRDPAAATALYAAAGLIVGLVFFSLGKGKLPSYILPLAPLVAVVVAWELGQELQAPRRRIVGPALLAATLGAYAVGFAGAGWRSWEGEFRRFALGAAVIYGAGLLATLPGLIARRPRWVWGSAVATSAVAMLAAALFLHPAVASGRSASTLIDAVPQLRGERAVVVVEIKVPSLTLYLDRVPEWISAPELEARLDEKDAPLIVVAREDLLALSPATRRKMSEIGRQGKFIVFEEPRNGDCPPSS